MRFTVVQDGVPIGTSELVPSELAAGVLEPLAAYETIRSRVRSATETLRSLGMLTPPLHEPVDPAALARAAVLVFELRDPAGALAPTDWVNVFEYTGLAPEYAVLARFRGAFAGTTATMALGQRGDEASSSPSRAEV